MTKSQVRLPGMANTPPAQNQEFNFSVGQVEPQKPAAKQPVEPEFEPEDAEIDQADSSVMKSELPKHVVESINASKTGKDFKIENIKDSTDLNLSEAALMTKKKLALEPRQPFFIPLEPYETAGAWRSVTINGYRFQIRKGEYVPLPITVIKLLMDSMNMESKVLTDNPYNLRNKRSVNEPDFDKSAGGI